MRGLYGRVCARSPSAPPPALATAVITGTVTLTGTQIAAVNAGPSTMRWPASTTTTTVRATTSWVRVVNQAGAPVGNVTVQMVDQWGNHAGDEQGGETDSVRLPALRSRAA